MRCSITVQLGADDRIERPDGSSSQDRRIGGQRSRQPTRFFDRPRARQVTAVERIDTNDKPSISATRALTRSLPHRQARDEGDVVAIDRCETGRHPAALADASLSANASIQSSSAIDDDLTGGQQPCG